MRLREVSLVLDVGANAGQYVAWLRASGYTGSVVSFEPLASAYDLMEDDRASDQQWRGVRAAVGATAGIATLNIADSTVLSSLLPSTSTLLNTIPGGVQRQAVDVPVIALDDVWSEYVRPSDRVMVKIDTQGYEHPVLDGLALHLDDVRLVEVEMSLVELYKGGSSIHDLLPRLHDAGFSVISIDSGKVDTRTGQVLDVDVLAGR